MLPQKRGTLIFYLDKEEFTPIAKLLPDLSPLVISMLPEDMQALGSIISAFLDGISKAFLSPQKIEFGLELVQKQIKKIRKRTALHVILKEDNQLLEEVVVVGYGTVKKSDLTGSVSGVSTRQFKNQPVKRVENILQGRDTRCGSYCDKRCAREQA